MVEITRNIERVQTTGNWPAAFARWQTFREVGVLRRILLVSLGVLIFFGTLNGPASVLAITNTTQKGSLLLFPKIVTYGPDPDGPPLVDTIITISNDNTIDVYLKCYWVDENQTVEDFQFRMTANQPIAFSAWGNDLINLTGAPGLLELPTFKNKVGQLLCWAVNAGDSTQIQFNHLYGESMIMSPAFIPIPYVTSATSIPAWSFRALQDPTPANGGVAGRIPLDGITYDACPKYLVGNFAPSGTAFPGGLPELALAPCRQDLRQDRIPTCAKAKFDVWNANEVKFTGTYQCLKCWYEGFLETIGNDPRQKGPGHGGSNFTYAGLKTFAARFRVQALYSTVCVGKTKGCPGAGDDHFTEAWGGPGKTTPLVGVFLYAYPHFDDELPYTPQTAVSLHSAGADGNGWILWDAADPIVPERPGR